MTNEELISKIKAEIERLKVDYLNRSYTFVPTAMQQLLDFIDTLESEKPIDGIDGLEVASVELADMLLAKPKDYAISAKADYWNGAHDGVIAGAKWQKEQMISALKNDGNLPIEFIDKFHEIDRIAFQNGQANMRDQMMKEAVEGEVYKFGEVAYVKECNNAELTKYLSLFNNGDKVKIIVIHETDIR